MRNLCLLFFAACYPVMGHAAQTSVNEQAPGVGMQDAVSWSVSLVLVLLLFFACVWFFKKSGHLSLAGAQSLRILTGLSLGMREKVVLIKVGEKEVLLGVTPGRIEKLLELDGEQRLYSQEEHVDNPAFASKLRQALGGQPSD